MKITAKHKGFILVVTAVILMVNLIAFINTYVSEKYETQLSGIWEDPSPKQIEMQLDKIEKQRMFILGVTLLTLVGTGILISTKKK